MKKKHTKLLLANSMNIDVLTDMLYPFKPKPFKYMILRGNTIYINYKNKNKKNEEILTTKAINNYKIYQAFLHTLEDY